MFTLRYYLALCLAPFAALFLALVFLPEVKYAQVDNGEQIIDI